MSAHIQELIKGLTSNQAAVRARSAKELGKFGLAAKNAFPLLVQAANDPQQNVREAAVHALIGFGASSVPYLIDFLQHQDKYVRRNAVWALGKLGTHSRSAIPELCHALKDDDPRTASGAAQALGALGELATAAIPALVEAMRGTNVVLCRLAAKALSQIGRPAVSVLIAHLKHHDPFVRGEAAVALGWVGPAAVDAVPQLIEVLRGGQTQERRQVNLSASFGSGPTTPVVDRPVGTELSTQEAARVQAAQALGRIGPGAVAAVAALREACDDPIEQLRQFAEIALRQIHQADGAE